MRYLLKTDICTFEIRHCGQYWELFADDECYGRSINPDSLADNVSNWATGHPEWDSAFLLVSGSLGDWLRLP